MSKYDWNEVKRLAADFQRAQLSSNLQRLTEKNCIEIVTKLVKTKLLDVVFTNDGKVYITPQHLLKEIKDELYVHGGRINLIDVAKLLNVDLNVVNSLAQEIVKEDSNVLIILGQIIDQSYITQITENITERLQQYGRVTISELTRVFDLPGDFIQSVIKDHVSCSSLNIKADKQDGNTYYTTSYLTRNKLILRGAFHAITKPTLLTTIMSQCCIDEQTFNSVIDSLMDSKQIPGVLTDRFSNMCTYIPHIYLKVQSESVVIWYRQNGYLEYNTLNRVGILDPKTFVKKVLHNEDLLNLQNCIIGPQILSQVEAAIEDAIVSHTWVDIMTVLPTALDAEDAELILLKILKKDQYKTSVQIFANTFVVTEAFISSINTLMLENIIPEKAEKVVSSGQYEQFILQSKISRNDEGSIHELSRKEERKKRANIGKCGGGTQGRETKTKSVKKKYGHKSVNKVNSDEDEHMNKKESANNVPLEIVKIEEIKDVLEKHPSVSGNDDTDWTELIEQLADYFYPLINKIALNTASSLYDQHVSNINYSRRKMHTALQDTIMTYNQDMKLYQKGLKHFNDNPDIEQQLVKYLMKSTGTQLVNVCFTFVSDKNDDITSAEGRVKVLATIEDKETKEAFSKLNKSLNGSSLEEFMNCVENVFDSLHIMVKKMDKKKEKNLLESHKKVLVEKLAETDNPALVLHLVCLILFQTVTQSAINASGRFVASILNFLQKHIPSDVYNSLQTYHDFVLRILKTAEQDENDAELSSELEEFTVSLKHIATSFKKTDI